MKGQFRVALMVPAWNPSTWEDEAGGLWVQGQPELHGEFQSSLSNIVRLCLKQHRKPAEEVWNVLGLGVTVKTKPTTTTTKPVGNNLRC